MACASASDGGTAIDNLRLRLVDGTTGKVKFDSEKDKLVLGLPTKPLGFCPNCGSKVAPIVYGCTSCSTRFIQVEDYKSHKKILQILPEDINPEDITQTPSQ